MVEKDTPVVQTMMPISLTFDHRIATGGEAARFWPLLLLIWKDK